MRREWLISALVIVLLLAAGTWFYFNFELREERVHVGYSAKAKKNPYLAAEDFLAQTGTRVHEIPSLLTLHTLPPTSDTLFINTPRSTLSAGLRQRLLAWVHQGGELIVVSWTLAQKTEPASDAGEKKNNNRRQDMQRSSRDKTPPRSTRTRPGGAAQHDALLDPLGVRQYINRPHQDDDKRRAGRPDADVASGGKTHGHAAQAADTHAKNAPARVRFGDHGEHLRVRFDPDYYLVDSHDRARDHIADAAGIHLLHYRLGKGGITVLSDDDFMRNTHIGEVDNAAFLWQLAHWNGTHNGVWIVLSDDMPSLPAWLFAHARPVLIALALLLLAGLWRAAQRFGPPLPVAAPARRSLREHLLASGRFLWQHGHHARLLAECRDALHRRIETVHPGWAALPPSALAEQLAALSTRPADEIKQVLSQPALRNEHEFTRFVDTLENLRKSL